MSIFPLFLLSNRKITHSQCFLLILPRIQIVLQEYKFYLLVVRLPGNNLVNLNPVKALRVTKK